MGDIKIDFKQWLQENYSQSSAYSYYSLVQKIFDKNFGDNQDWQQYSESVIPLLVRYFEFANREYYLDRVTIWYALDYFEKILKFIYPKQTKIFIYEPTVKIFVFSRKKDYYIYDASLYNLSDCLKCLANMLYGYSIKYSAEHLDYFQQALSLSDIKDIHKTQSLENVAIHISYENSQTMRKVALLKYHTFLAQSKYKYQQIAPLQPAIAAIKSQNPNKTVHGHYKIVQQISGSNPLQIEANNEADRLDINYTLTKQDLSKIFDLNLATIDNLLKLNKWKTNKTAEYSDDEYNLGKEITSYISKHDVIIEFETEIRTYYSADNINLYLKDSHHPCPNPRYDVNYNKKGYKYWCNREQALKTLGIGKTSFYKYLRDKSNKIPFAFFAYTPGTTKYYIPEIKKISQDSIFRKIRKNSANSI